MSGAVDVLIKVLQMSGQQERDLYDELDANPPLNHYPELLNYIHQKFGDYLRKSLNWISIAELQESVMADYGNTGYTIKKFHNQLIKLNLLGEIELHPMSHITARNLGVKLVRIDGVDYGRMKILIKLESID